MKAILVGKTLFIIATLVGSTNGRAQGSFENLDFESPIPPLTPDEGFTVPISNALPGWFAYAGELLIDRVLYNTVSIGTAAVSFHDHESLLQPVHGSYSVLLQPSIPGLQTSVALAQTGQIPSTAVSLFFYGTPSMQVSFDGQPISLITVSSTMDYVVRAGDISQVAGQIGELKFLQPVAPLGSVMAWLDNIQFSTEPVPEPNTLSLFALGSLLLGWRTRRMRKT